MEQIWFLSILLLLLSFDGNITVSSSYALLLSLAGFHCWIVLLLERNVWLHRETNLSASSCCLIMLLWWGKSCISLISSLIWFVVRLHKQLHWYNGRPAASFGVGRMGTAWSKFGSNLRSIAAKRAASAKFIFLFPPPLCLLHISHLLSAARNEAGVLRNENKILVIGVVTQASCTLRSCPGHVLK